VVAIETVRNVLKRHGLWKNGKRKKKRKNRGTTADSPTKTMNIDLCFEEVHEPNFSTFARSHRKRESKMRDERKYRRDRIKLKKRNKEKL